MTETTRSTPLTSASDAALMFPTLSSALTMFFGVLLAPVIGLQAEGDAVVLPLLAISSRHIPRMRDLQLPLLRESANPPMGVAQRARVSADFAVKEA